jgi:hypothetical protein
MNVLSFPTTKRAGPLRAEEEELLATLRAILAGAGPGLQGGSQGRPHGRLTLVGVHSAPDGWSKPSCPTTSIPDTRFPA